jgi:hypothetical protein
MENEQQINSIIEEMRSITIRIEAMRERNFDKSEIDKLVKVKIKLQKQLICTTKTF